MEAGSVGGEEILGKGERPGPKVATSGPSQNCKSFPQTDGTPVTCTPTSFVPAEGMHKGAVPPEPALHGPVLRQHDGHEPQGRSHWIPLPRPGHLHGKQWAFLSGDSTAGCPWSRAYARRVGLPGLANRSIECPGKFEHHKNNE